tara:strand:+ start:639 stop:1235 length:597 start_codon:yes stop_codon:yes gene_type:complete
MIHFINNNSSKPFQVFREKYNLALKKGQESIEAISVSSYSPFSDEVNSRFVNLKIIDDEQFIFFTNYNSPKSREFEKHNQVSVVFFWNKTNTQIRIKAKISKTSKSFNNDYFSDRSIKKNALAISSNQSEVIDSYERVIENFQKSLQSDDLEKCPDFWGGFSFIPYYFEFWEGHNSRLNKREAFIKNNKNWDSFLLQP